MRTVTLIPGDGTGPEISDTMCAVVEATGVKIEWETAEAGESAIGKYGTPLPDKTIESVKKNKVAIKGPVTTPIGSGFRSVNVALRKALNLYACLRPSKSMKGVKGPYENIDIVVVRENMEDLYAGIEHMVGNDAAESIKIITRENTKQIAHYAFQYAVMHARKKVTIVHKANIMKCTDGLFLETCREVAKDYPQIQSEDRIVDNMCMQLVQKPHLYDVLLCPNLYGDILSDLCAGLVGGLGVAPGANIGEKYALFEAVHGSAPKYKGQNKVNPTALILSAALMLEHMNEGIATDRIRKATEKVIGEGKNVTYDLGGKAGTKEMANAIIQAMKK